MRTELEMVEGKIDPNDINETNIDKLPKVVKDERINSLVDEYYALNFEDIIADGLKTKYKVTILIKYFYFVSLSILK